MTALFGSRKGWSGFTWMLKILAPISLLTAIFEYSGLINRIDFLLTPVMGFLSMSPKAALPIIAGMLTGIYGGIASMAMLNLTMKEMTLIAVFILISHNLIQEGIIQGMSGLNIFKATVVRLATSVITVLIVARFIQSEPVSLGVAESITAAQVGFSDMLMQWGVSMAYLAVKIFVIIMILMLIMEFMKQFNIINHIVNLFYPLLKLMGLGRQAGFLWLAAGLFGLSYGAAVIVEEAKEGYLTGRELEKLHYSIGINHALVEDPALFLPLGLSPFWLWVPRLTAAVAVVHIFTVWLKIRGKKSLVPDSKRRERA